MDALLRGGRVLLIAAALGACTPRSREPVGTSLGGGGGGAAPAASAAASASAAPLAGLPRDFRTAWTRVGSVAMSGHGAGEWSDVVYASREAKDAVAEGTTVPDGGALAADHASRGADGGAVAGPTFLMTRGAGGWRFAIAAPGGKAELDGPADAGVPLPTCARCHADAPHDGVFPLPQ